MPWSPDDAQRHSKKAKSGKAKKQWSAIANSILKKTGNDGEAVRIANGVIKKRQKSTILKGQ
jgi:hypothetical protein